jgi:hypothetical protein
VFNYIVALGVMRICGNINVFDIQLNIKHKYQYIVKVCDVDHGEFNWVGMVHEDMIRKRTTLNMIFSVIWYLMSLW